MNSKKTYTPTNKEYWMLLVIPIEFLIGNTLSSLPFLHNNNLALAIASVSLFLIGFLVITLFFRKFLGSQFRDFIEDPLISKLKINKWLNFLLKLVVIVLLVIGSFYVLAFTRQLLAGVLSSSSQPQVLSVSSAEMILASPYFGLFMALQPFLAPFAEELSFRYLLFWKIPARWLKFIMFFVSAILFGLIHFNNFGGNVVATIPYMVIGAYFSLIYILFKNIWGSLFVHWIFNTTNSMYPALLLIILPWFGIGQ